MTEWEALVSVVETVELVKELRLDYRRPPRNGHHRPTHIGHLHPPRNDTLILYRIVQLVNGVMLYLPNGLFRTALLSPQGRA